MAWTQIIEDKNWTNTSGDPKTNAVNVYYDSRRDGKDMKYKFRFVYSIGSYSWYDWELRVKIYLNNSETPKDIRIKPYIGGNPHWPNNTYTLDTSEYTVKNKVSGDVDFKFTTYGIEYGDNKNKLTYTNKLPIVTIKKPTISKVSASSTITSKQFQIKAKATASSSDPYSKEISRRTFTLFKGNTSIDSGTWHDDEYVYSSYNDGLLPNTKYKIVFTAVNNYGISSEITKEITTPEVTPPSGRPTNLSVSPAPISPSTKNLSIMWNKPESSLGTKVGFFGYKVNVYKNDKKVNSNKLAPNGKSTKFYWIESSASKISLAQTSWQSSSITYKANDKLYFEVTPFVYYKGVFYTTDSAYKKSSIFTVISDVPKISILTTSGWKSGKIFVKDGNNWKQAKAIWVKSGTSWKKAKQ